MNINLLTLNSTGFPGRLRPIPQCPQQLYALGESLDNLLQRPCVAIVGARNMTPYGRLVTTQIATNLAERGIVIISGLAIGVDATAHQAAIDAGGQTIAVLPSPLDNILPATNRRLAQLILDTGGALVSEYAPGSEPHKGNFVERNRLMSGLADAVLITEAAERSGSLHTSDFAADQGRLLLAVPGAITSKKSAGTNNLLKDGALVVTSYHDVLLALNLNDEQQTLSLAIGRNPQEQAVLHLLRQGITDGQQLLQKSGFALSTFNQTITMLEVGGKIRAIGSNHWSL